MALVLFYSKRGGGRGCLRSCLHRRLCHTYEDSNTHQVAEPRYPRHQPPPHHTPPHPRSAAPDSWWLMVVLQVGRLNKSRCIVDERCFVYNRPKFYIRFVQRQNCINGIFVLFTRYVRELFAV